MNPNQLTQQLEGLQRFVILVQLNQRVHVFLPRLEVVSVVEWRHTGLSHSKGQSTARLCI